MEDQITDGCLHRRHAHVCVSMRACVGGFGRPRIRAANVRALSVSVECMWLDSQAFQQAMAFNADIGAWNTARVTMLNSVCAASEGVQYLWVWVWVWLRRGNMEYMYTTMRVCVCVSLHV